MNTRLLKYSPYRIPVCKINFTASVQSGAEYVDFGKLAHFRSLPLRKWRVAGEYFLYSVTESIIL